MYIYTYTHTHTHPQTSAPQLILRVVFAETGSAGFAGSADRRIATCCSCVACLLLGAIVSPAHGWACEEEEEDEEACEEAAWVYWKMASSQFCHIYYMCMCVCVCVCVCVHVHVHVCVCVYHTYIDIWKMASSEICHISAPLTHLGGTCGNPATISHADNARKVENLVLSLCEKKIKK
jgi:hypothetical protein